jgi:hypothetical protein
VTPLAADRFRIALDRTWPKSPVCVAVRHLGNQAIRDAVQPGYLILKPNLTGTAQIITFERIPDQIVGTASLPLRATANSGMPVEFFVVAGPAIVEGGILKFLPIPPRSRLPLEITVTAWQWGRAIDPQVQTAKPVTQSFLLTSPAPPPRD